MKKCDQCKKEKTEDNFTLVKDKRRKNKEFHTYRKNICKVCELQYVNEFKKNKKERIKKEKKLIVRKQNIDYISNNKNIIIETHRKYPKFHKYISSNELMKLIIKFDDELFLKLKKFQKSVRAKEYQKKYRIKRKEKLIKQCADYYLANKEYILKENKKYRIKNAEYLRQQKKEYKRKNKNILRDKYNKYQKERWHNDPQYKLRMRISSYIRNNLVKDGSISDYLPYSIEELKKHLESQFEPWMNWNNWGSYKVSEWDDNDKTTWKWQIDHIIPHSLFTYSSMKDKSFIKCWALSNLRPLSAKKNLIDGATKARHFSKGNKII